MVNWGGLVQGALRFIKRYLLWLLLVPATVLLLVSWGVWFEDTDFGSFQPSPQCAPIPAGTEVYRAIAFGDFGANTPFQRTLALRMKELYKKQPYQTALLLGDNIYPDGDVKRAAKSHFETPYRFMLDNKVRFVTALGNHDLIGGHVQDQLAYFKMPGLYYQVSDGPVDYFVLHTFDFAQNLAQQEWFKNALSKSKAPWKIVIAHHPVYSSGRHGGRSVLRARLLPILLKNKVDLYLSGHDHSYERFKPEGALHMVVSGGGGAFLYQFKKKILPNSIVHLRTHHFVSLEISGTRLALKAINKSGQVIDCETWEKNDGVKKPAI